MATELDEALDDCISDLEWALEEIDKHSQEYQYVTDPAELRAAKDGLLELRARVASIRQ